MANNNDKKIRQKVQMVFALAFLATIILYNLYIKEILSFKVLGIADLNPYGAWSTLKDWVIDSNFEFDGINRSIALTVATLSICVLGGRFLCGWICPLGTFQDFGNFIGGTMPFKKAVNTIRNSFGTSVMHNEHSAASSTKHRTKVNETFPHWAKVIPFSFIVLITLLLLSILGFGAKIAELSPWRALLNLPRLFTAWSEIRIGVIILLLVFLLSIIIPRFFCRFLCPFGAIQTLFSSFSLCTIKKGEECTSCNACLKDCPMGIKPNVKEDSVSPECIRCMNCVDNCVISKDRSLALRVGNKKAQTKTYAFFMIAAFILIWLGLPKLRTAGAIGSNISTANLKDGVYRGEAKGFAARIVSEVKINNGNVIEINVIDHHESKGWYDEVFMVLPREIIKKQSLEVDAISGATKTSKGLIRSIESALKKAY